MMKSTRSVVIVFIAISILLIISGIYFHKKKLIIGKLSNARNLSQSIENVCQLYINTLYSISAPQNFISPSEAPEQIVIFDLEFSNDEVKIIHRSGKNLPDSSILGSVLNQMQKIKTDSNFFFIPGKDSLSYPAHLSIINRSKNNNRGVLIIKTKPIQQLINELSNYSGNVVSIVVIEKGEIIAISGINDCAISLVKSNLNSKNEEITFQCRINKAKRNFVAFQKSLLPGLILFTVADISSPILFPFILFLTSYIFLIALTFILYFLSKNKLQKQIKEINDVVNSISSQDFDRKIPDKYKGELALLARSINKMSMQLKEVYENLELRIIRRTSEISMRNAELRNKQHEILKQNNELKSAYDALKESREKYENLIEHLEEEYIFFSQSIKGDLLFVSPSVKKILGFSVKEFRNLHDSLYTDNPINIIAKERSANARIGISQPKYMKEIIDKNNQPVILEISEVPVFNEDGQLVSVEGLAHDITERQKAEELIKEQEEKYRMLFTHASDFIFLYEIDKKNKTASNIIEANNYTIEKLGYSIDELRQLTPTSLIAAGENFDEEEKNAEFMANDVKYERIWKSKDGSMIDVEISSHAFKIKKQTLAIAVARDITDRKRAEDEIKFVNEELYNQKENLEALVDNLTQTQEQLVQSEKMAALGQLIAGIAHEINTPLGAIKASIGNLSDSLENALGELPTLLQDQSRENLLLFNLLFEFSRKKTPELSSREKRQIKRELTGKLKKEGIEHADILGDIFVYLEIYEIDDLLIDYIKLPDSLKVVRSARNFISLLKNTNTINIAVEKATKVVFALKKYAHRDAIGEKVSTDIIDGIETVLTLYNNQLKQGIEVIKKYNKLPLVQCYQDEISQVWTNLIQNAIQAMKQEGTLTISAEHDNDMVVVSFKDTGVGIEPDIKDKIFEPFFTTKKQGEGSGLGLDIVKKIIDKHDGIVEVESELGEGALFIIKIPVK